MKNAQSQKVIIGILCVVVFAVVWYQFSWNARASTLSQADAVQVATQSKQGELAAANKAKENEEANRAALIEAQKVLPTSADAQGVIRQLTALAVTSSVDWQSVSLDSGTAADVGLDSMSLTVTISGTMPNIEAYLANIRVALSRIITVDGVATTFGTDPDVPDVVTSVLSLRAFMYTVDPKLVATSTTVAGSTATPAGSVPTAVTDPTNVGATATTVAP